MGKINADEWDGLNLGQARQQYQDKWESFMNDPSVYYTPLAQVVARSLRCVLSSSSPLWLDPRDTDCGIS
jgi:hypothetical protein